MGELDHLPSIAEENQGVGDGQMKYRLSEMTQMK